MDALVTFLRERLNYDAQRSIQWHDLECDFHAHSSGGILNALAAGRMLSEVPGAVCDCDGPARILAAIEVKREIIRLAEQARHNASLPEVPWAIAPSGATFFVSGFAAAMEHALRLYAQAYSDHPDYLPEWAAS